jgi:hypothetical protein
MTRPPRRRARRRRLDARLADQLAIVGKAFAYMTPEVRQALLVVCGDIIDLSEGRRSAAPSIAQPRPQ